MDMNGETVQDTGISEDTSAAPSSLAASSGGTFKATSSETLTEEVVSKYLSKIASDTAISFAEIRDELLRRINAAIAFENKLRGNAKSSSPQINKIHALDESVVVSVLLARTRIVSLSLSGSGLADEAVLGIYQDIGPNEGLYLLSETTIGRLASEVKPSMSANATESLMKRLRMHAPVVSRTTDPHLIPVANGVFDHSRQELMPFSPDWVFLTKSPVSYDEHAENPVIVMPDGESWDVETWISELSDDEGVPELLWEIISATIRPGVRWNKAAFLHSAKGNNGKGTYCALIRELVGRRGWASIPIANFGKPFALTELIHARAIITDENSVGAFAKDLADFKSVVTGDSFALDRKHRDPISVSFSGMVIQCVNDFPKSRDKSASYTRRQLFVPFNKWFGNTERKYIKDDYLKRPEVLRYVLKRALQMQQTEFSNPDACQELLDQFQRENNPVRDFWAEFEEQFVWDLLPTAFLYELFLGWFRATHPSGTPLNRNDFSSHLLEVLGGNAQWIYTDPQKKHRPGTHMNEPEPLVAEYQLTNWMNSHYPGSDVDKKCIPSPLRANYIGVRRAPQPALVQGGTTAAPAGTRDDSITE